MTRRVVEVARRQLAAHGVAALSVRAVARDMGMVSSAVYRYVPSREALVALLVADAYDAVGEVAERADRATAARGDAGARWLAVARAVRQWALAHPHEFSLIFETLPMTPPAPGDRPAVRLWRVVLAVMEAAVTSGALAPSRHRLAVDGVLDPRLRPLFGETQRPPFEDAPVRAIALMSGLIGAVSVELHGHYHRFSHDLDALFDLVMAAVADGAGLRLPVGPPGPVDGRGGVDRDVADRDVADRDVPDGHDA